MAKLTRKSAKLFAENAAAAAGGIAQFGSLAAGTPNYSTDPDVIQALSAYSNGWSDAVLGTKSPAMEDRNALDYLLSYQQAYIMQRGVPEWIDTETYYQGSFVSKADGKMYVSKIDNNTNHDPATDTSETYWLRFPTPAEVAAKVAKAGDTMTGNLIVQANIEATGTITTPTPDNSSNTTITPTTAWVRNVAKRYGPKMSSGVSFSSGDTIPVSALVVVKGNVGNYLSGTLYVDGEEVAASPNNEGTARHHCVNCIVSAGAKVTFSNFGSASAKYYPLEII